MEFDDHYELLGVTSSSTHEQIKKAYQLKLFVYHPDKQRDKNISPQMFQRIQDAWEVLSNPESRKAYDQENRWKKQIASTHSSTDIVLLSEFCVTREGSKCTTPENCNTEDLLYSRQCRCGDAFEISQEDLEAGFNTIQCNGCSLYVTVIDDRSSTTASIPGIELSK